METTIKIRSFTDLIAWQEARKIVKLIYDFTDIFPKSEQFGLTDQLRRAAISVSSNIAEGFSKKTKKEKVHFYHTALASLTEIQNQSIIARDVGYIDKDCFDVFAHHTVIASKLINALIKSAPSK